MNFQRRDLIKSLYKVILHCSKGSKKTKCLYLLLFGNVFSKPFDHCFQHLMDVFYQLLRYGFD